MEQKFNIFVVTIIFLFFIAFLLIIYLLTDYYIERSHFVYIKGDPNSRRCKKCGAWQSKSPGDKFFEFWVSAKRTECECNKYAF